MGQFIDTQQGILSEAKQTRIEREAKKQEKELKSKLLYELQTYFYNELVKDYKEQQLCYHGLLEHEERERIIIKLTKRTRK